MLFPDAAQLVDYSSMNASSRSAAATRRAQRRSSQHAPRRRRSGASVASMASEAEAPLVSAHDHAGAFSADSAIGGSLNLHNGLYMASKDAVLVTDHAKYVDSAPETVSTHLTWHDACFLPAVCVDGRRFAATFLAAVDDDLAREKSARIAAHEALVDKMHKAVLEVKGEPQLEAFKSAAAARSIYLFQPRLAWRTRSPRTSAQSVR